MSIVPVGDAQAPVVDWVDWRRVADVLAAELAAQASAALDEAFEVLLP